MGNRNGRKRLSRWTMCAVLAVALTVPSVAAAADAVQLRLATVGIGSAWYSYGAGIADLMKPNLPKGSTVDVLPIAGTFGNIKLLQSGETELALSFPMAAAEGCGGFGEFDKKQDKVRGLMGGLDVYYYGTFVTVKSGIKSWEEIAGGKARLATTKVGGSGEMGLRQILGLYGSSKAGVAKKGGSVKSLARTATAAAIGDGKADGWAHVVTRGHPVATELTTLTNMNMLPLSDSVIKGMVDKHGWVEAVIPPNTFKGQTAPVKTVKAATNVLIRAGVSDDVAYITTKTHHRERGQAEADPRRPFQVRPEGRGQGRADRQLPVPSRRDQVLQREGHDVALPSPVPRWLRSACPSCYPPYRRALSATSMRAPALVWCFGAVPAVVHGRIRIRGRSAEHARGLGGGHRADDQRNRRCKAARGGRRSPSRHDSGGRRACVHGVFCESGAESGGAHGGCGRRLCSRLRCRHRLHRGSARSMPAGGGHHAHVGWGRVHRIRLHGTLSARPDLPSRTIPQAVHRPSGALDIGHVRNAGLGVGEHGLLLRAGRRISRTFGGGQTVRRHRLWSHGPVLGAGPARRQSSPLPCSGRFRAAPSRTCCSAA